LAVLLGAAWAGLTWPAGIAEGAAPPSWPADHGIAQLADNLLRDLEAEALGAGDRLRVAVWPFAEDRVPLAAERAQALNRALRLHLAAQAPGWLRLVARDDLHALLDEAREFGAEGNPVAALVDGAAVDVLIVGHIGRRGDHLLVSYDAYRVHDGAQVATSGAVVLKDAATSDGPQLTLDAAIRQIARQLRRGAADMTELHLSGVRYQDSGLQPPFGAYLQDLLQGALEREIADALTGRKLVVRTAAMAETDLQRLRVDGTLAAGPAPLDPEQFDRRRGIYVLSGSYWEAGMALDVRFRLRDGRGASISERRLVRADSLPTGVALRPTRAGRPGGGDRPGPIGLRLSSDRGPDPVYRVGDRLNLLIELQEDAWLYCFYGQADGRIVKIIPNRHYRVARLRGGRVHTLPGRLLPFELHLRPPAGAESIKCFAAGEDVAARLPRDLRRTDGAMLPAGWDWRLPFAFRKLNDVAISEASLMITLQP